MLDLQTLTEEETAQLNGMENFLSFVQTWAFDKFIHCPHKVIALFTGNQSMKTASATYSYVMRIYGAHPIPEKNVLYFECQSRACENGHRYKKPPEDMICKVCNGKLGKFTAHKFGPYQVPAGMRHLTDGKPTETMNCPRCQTQVTEHKRRKRIFRFASETLPSDKENTGDKGESAEIKNTLYPEFKKWCPPMLILKDITARVSSMTILDPFGRGNIIIEFVSYNQPTQAGAGVQRMSILCDEEPPIAFWEEQKPRLMSEDGDIVLTLTPATGVSWTFDEIYEKAKIYYRTKAVADFIGKDQIERTESIVDVAVIQAATDDNPTLDKRVIETMFDTYEDPDVIATRRYGIHKQSTGRIHDFQYPIHFIDREKYFPDPPGMFPEWVHARMEDFHQSTNLAIVWIALSPYDEAFVYQEWNPSPEKLTTYEVARRIADMSKDYRYTLDLIDPLADITQVNTGRTVIDDMNRHMKEFKINGIGTGAYWRAWDTKSLRGRDQVRMRLKNAVECQRPFNNLVKRDGREVRIPTLWILNNCKLVAQSLKQWRKDERGEPEQRYSHFNCAIEAVMKEQQWRPRRNMDRQESREPLGIFQGRR